MRRLSSSLVDIIREFLSVHELASSLVARRRAGSLRFDDVRAWVGDDARSDLFRLKELCHAIFRPAPRSESPPMRVGALLDLAVGSLFHELMKLRENLYQQERYRPRVEALRAEGDAESHDLFREFEKLLDQSAQSLDQSVLEVATLLEQSRKQLLRLIVEQGRTGITARCLYENASRIAAVDAAGLDDLYERMFGDAASGYAMAGESYLDSAYYGEAHAAFAAACRRAPERRDVQTASSYAEGMQAFFSRDYARSVACLAAWLDGGATKQDDRRLQHALAGMSHVERLPASDEVAEVIGAAAAVAVRMRALAPA